MIRSERETAVLDAFEMLMQGLGTLSEHIRQDSDRVAWIHAEATLGPTLAFREKVIEVIHQVYYAPGQLPREITVCAGLVGASADTLALAERVNQLKIHFKQRVLALKENKSFTRQPEATAQFSEILMRFPTTATALRNIGLARLHLKQCYRQIPLLPHAPSKISWTWAHTRSIKKISRDMALQLLHKRGDDIGIQLQIQKLSTLSPHEPLAIVQELAPHLRANVVFERSDGVTRCMIKGPVPIFFPADPATPLPQFCAPVPRKEKNQHRSTRSDVKLDPIVFLPAIRAHRYSHTA